MDSNMEKGLVAVIIVLYNSNESNYTDLLDRKDLFLILVDNTPRRDLELSGGNICYIPLLENRGIATAQNFGIHKAEELGCTHVIFFDQDSMLSFHLVEELLEAYSVVAAFDPKVAAVGPLVINKVTGMPYKSTAELSRKHSEVRELISSGSVVALQTFREVGYMMDQLFIDAVDYEWCWRAKSKGYYNYMATQVKLYHQVGSGLKKIGFGVSVFFPAPFRYYYIYRNTLILQRKPYVPKEWKRKQFIRNLFEFFVIPIMRHRQGWTIFKNMLKGCFDGIREK